MDVHDVAETSHVKVVELPCMSSIHSPGLTGVQEGCEYHSAVHFQLGDGTDPRSLPYVFPQSAKAVLALEILALTSSSMLTERERVLPRYVNLSTA